MIKQFKDPSVQAIWGDYSTTGAPEKYSAKVDELVWGKKSNLWTLVTDVATDKKYCFSTYSNNNYSARKSDFSLRKSECGQVLEIVTKVVNDRPVLMSAIPSNDAE